MVVLGVFGDEAIPHATHGGVGSAKSARPSVIRLARDEKLQVSPTGTPNRWMKSSAEILSSSRLLPSASVRSSSRSRGIPGASDAAEPAPTVTARFGLLSSSIATTR